MGWREELEKQKRAAELEIKRRMRDLSHDARELEARGHQVVRAAIRNGQNVIARTPSEVRQLGLAAAQGRLPQELGGMVAKKVVAVQPAKKPVQTAQRKPAPSQGKPADQQVRAAISGAVDEFTLGAADHVLSAGDAILAGGLSGFGDRHKANMAEKRAEDAYDSQHYGAARTAGRVAGFAGGMVAMGGAGLAGRAALATMPRGVKLMTAIAKAPKLGGVDKRGLVQLAGGGGAGVGAATQAAEDVAARRLSDPGQYVAAAAGGAVDGLATLRYGPMRGGAAGGAVDSIGSDLADGRAPSVEHAIGAAHGGAILGRAGDLIGTYGTAMQSNKIKGEIGEALSYGKTLARGIIPDLKKNGVAIGNGRVSKPDQQIHNGYVEAKMGPGADLTKNQRQLRIRAAREGKEFIVDAWRFRDAGKAAGIIAAPTGALWIDEDGAPWEGR